MWTNGGSFRILASWFIPRKFDKPRRQSPSKDGAGYSELN
jgi:hypothetical protein